MEADPFHLDESPIFSLKKKKRFARKILTATEFRHHYQAPARIHDFMDFSWKYGCNANRHIPAKGVVPTVTFSHIQNQENIKQMTTYQRDFGKEYFNIISILNSLDPEQVNKYIERAPKQGRKLSSDKLSECK
uniref:Testis expressed 26 n=2 Tax=Terrapene triunguis TaxID=2587831 RepID=A0A674INN7_9SAUR